jgi:hypothetical protein
MTKLQVLESLCLELGELTNKPCTISQVSSKFNLIFGTEYITRKDKRGYSTGIKNLSFDEICDWIYFEVSNLRENLFDTQAELIVKSESLMAKLSNI